MKITIACPICAETFTVDYDGDALYGTVSITDLAIMELTVTPAVGEHMRSHSNPASDGGGFEFDPRYWRRLREHLELKQAQVSKWLEQLDERGLGKPDTTSQKG